MNNQKQEEMDRFIQGEHKELTFLGYISEYDELVEEKLKEVGKYVTKEELQACVCMAIESTFVTLNEAEKAEKGSSRYFETVFIEFFDEEAEINKRANMPLELELRRYATEVRQLTLTQGESL